MINPIHVRTEIVRTLRNRRALAFSLALPLVLFYAIAGSQPHARSDGISFPLYFMGGMATYGALFAVLSVGGRIAIDRGRGWTRQLRVTPLSVGTYFVAKVLAAYAIALPTLLLLYIAGATLGVGLGTMQWFQLTALLLVGLLPFVVLAIAVGHVLMADAVLPAVGGLAVFFGLFGGAWGSFFNSGAMLALVKLLPSFWLVQAVKAAVLDRDWPVEGWLVIAVWTIVLVWLAALAYRRDTGRA